MMVQLPRLYRPVGQAEMDLIPASRFREFPPRLPDQPIFYPVLTEEYATQIARGWNTKDERSGCVGYCCDFKCRRSFSVSTTCLLLEAESTANTGFPLRELNANIVGEIELVSEFHGAVRQSQNSHPNVAKARP
jgi:hypothetical protein